MLRGRQRPTRSRAGGVVRGIDLPVFGKGSRPAGGGVSEVPSGVETGTGSEIVRRRFPCHDVSLSTPAVVRARLSRGGNESSIVGVVVRMVMFEVIQTT